MMKKNFPRFFFDRSLGHYLVVRRVSKGGAGGAIAPPLSRIEGALLLAVLLAPPLLKATDASGSALSAK